MTVKMRASPENDVHIPVLNLIRKHVTRFVWHTPNGGNRSFSEGMEFRKLGVRSGVPDLMFVVQGQVYFLELKAPGKTPSENQKQFARDAKEAGAHWAWARSKVEAVDHLIFWKLLPASFVEREAA
jgi:hypothetical protein